MGAAARKTRAASEPARATESESESESETIGAEGSDSGLDGHGVPKETIEAAESGSESGGGLDGHGGPKKKKKKTGGARESESGSGSGFRGLALQQRRGPGESR